MGNDITKKMLNVLREGMNKVDMANSLPEVPSLNESKKMNFIEDADYLMSRIEKKKINEETETNSNSDEFVITKTTPQFGDVFESQTSALLKAIGEGVDFGEKALIYYPKDNDLVLQGKIKSLNIAFQFKYADLSGEGIYIWMNGCQLTESNLRTIGKIRDGFVNWKTSLVQNSDLLEKLKKVSQKK